MLSAYSTKDTMSAQCSPTNIIGPLMAVQLPLVHQRRVVIGYCRWACRWKRVLGTAAFSTAACKVMSGYRTFHTPQWLYLRGDKSHQPVRDKYFTLLTTFSSSYCSVSANQMAGTSQVLHCRAPLNCIQPHTPPYKIKGNAKHSNINSQYTQT